ncbi:antitoxin [Nakamurella flavida]|uniref:Antitoxin n=1 Tax=Nakamurella flavida TaxID=363630 RepID=A0A938YN43_9ACTN|nr:antitoxin [Nakamurella flavida]MBM9476412.1 antitoxin [Nakamurella flavida]MDP9779487.1 putative membrane protein [Nakamurella flavida]
MVDFNELRNKAQSLLSEHSDQVKSGIDKVGEVVGRKVGHDKADPIEQKLHGLVDRLKGDTDPAAEQTTGDQAPTAPTAQQPTPTDPGPEPTVPAPAPTPPAGPAPTTPVEPTLPEQPGSPSATGRY